MSWWAEAEVRPVGNYTPGAQAGGPIYYLFLHHSVGPLDAAEARFNDRASSASAHFGNPLDASARMRQWVDTDDVAWAQVNGNWIRAVSVETESYADDARLSTPMNEPQLARVAALARWLNETRGFPLQVSDDPGTPGLVYHSMNPPAWGITACPGQPIIDQRPEIIACASGFVPPKRKRPGMDILVSKRTSGPTAGAVECWLVIGNVCTQQFTGAPTPPYGVPDDAIAFAAGEIPIRGVADGTIDLLSTMAHRLLDVPPGGGGGSVDPAALSSAVRAELDRTRLTRG